MKNAGPDATEKMRTGEDIAAVRPLVTEKATAKTRTRRSPLKVNAISSKTKELAAEEKTALLITMKKQQVKEGVVLEDAAAEKAIEVKEAAIGENLLPGGLTKALKVGEEEPLRQGNKMPQFADFTTKEIAQKARIVTTGTPRCASTSREATANMEINASIGIPRLQCLRKRCTILRQKRKNQRQKARLKPKARKRLRKEVKARMPMPHIPMKRKIMIMMKIHTKGVARLPGAILSSR
ncbi:MAG: hypothetical protein OSA95_08545 [Opitutales bacterium]|nr:hypothetical protein [Opitutales bacterium]